MIDLLAAAVREVPADQIRAPLGPQIVFWALAALVIIGSLVTITRRNLVSAVMALVATFFGIAGLYAMLSAHFLAAIQVLVYAGGIMVLFVFVVMVLNREDAEPWAMRHLGTFALGASAITYLTVRLMQLLIEAGPLGGQPIVRLPLRAEAPPQGFGTTGGLGELFFTEYLFPFEAISILLVIAIVGAVVLARTTVAKATSHYELPEGDVDLRQPQHGSEDEVVGIPYHHAPKPGQAEGGGH
jgi:NADH-quinone oxidoreductase subunit J